MADNSLSGFVDSLNQMAQGPNANTAEAQITPRNDLDAAVLSGAYRPKGKSIDVVDRKGTSYNLPSDQLVDALKQGYSLETPSEKAQREFRKEYSGLKGDVAVAFGQAADEFLGGIPETIADHTMSKDAFDLKEKLKEDHPISNTIGGVGGFALSAFYGGPLANLFGTAEKAGSKVAQEIVAKSLAEKGITRGAKDIGTDIIARSAEGAAKLGTEGLIVSAPKAITEATLGDPNAAAETLLMGGGFGVAFGLAGGPAGVIFDKANARIQKAIEARLPKASGEAAESAGSFVAKDGSKTAPNPMEAGDGTLVGSARAEGFDDSILEKIQKSLGRKKSNADEIVSASESLGLPVMEEQVAHDKVVQDFASALSQKATLPGIKKAQQYQQRFDTYDKHLKEILNFGDSAESKFAVGQKAKADIMKSAQDQIATEGAVFNELRMGYDDIKLDAKPMEAVARNIRKIADSAIDDQAASVARNVAKKIEEGRVSSLNDLFELRTQIRDLYSPTSSGSVKKLISDLTEKLNYQEEQTINRAIKSRIEAASVPGAATLEETSRLQALYDDMQGAKQRWSEMAKSLEDSGDALGLGTIRNPRDFVRKLDGLTPEQVVAKLIPKNDVESLLKLKEKFPEQFQAVAQLKKAEMLEHGLHDGKISARKFVTQYNKMSPELRGAIFDGEQSSLLNAIKTDLESLPANVNPSGTAKTTSYMNLLSKDNLLNPSFYLENISDIASSAALRKVINVDDLIAAQKGMAAVGKQLDKIPAAIISISQGAKNVAEKTSTASSLGAVAQMFGHDSHDDKNFRELSQKIANIASSPEYSVSKIGDRLAGFGESAPNVASAFNQKLTSTMQYIYQNMPKSNTPENPFNKVPFKPSDAELAKFDRKMSVVMNPFVVIDALKEGSLTREHVDALAANYPMLYDAIKQRILNHVIESKDSIPYQARLKLSLIMGMNIDGSINPQSIMSLQNSFALGNQMDQNGDGLSQSGLNKMEPGKMTITGPQGALMPKE